MAGANPLSVAVGDLNGDGVPDLAVDNFYSRTVSVLLGDGDGTFQLYTDYATGASPESIAESDFNGDGVPDLATADPEADAVGVLLNTTPTAAATGKVTADGVWYFHLRAVDGPGVGGPTASLAVRIDTTPPTTTDDADDAWHNTPVTVTFTATDPNLPDASDVAYTEYSLDGGTSWSKGSSVIIPVPADHSNDGLHTILYRSTDNAGNSEEAKSCTVKIDTTPPVISVAYLSVSHHHHHPWWATHRSSVARGHHTSWHTWSHHGSRLSLTYRIDDNLSPTVAVTIEFLGLRGRILQTISLGQCPTGVQQVYRLPSKLPRGFYRLRVTATDLAGNTQSTLAGSRPFMQQ